MRAPTRRCLKSRSVQVLVFCVITVYRQSFACVWFFVLPTYVFSFRVSPCPAPPESRHFYRPPERPDFQMASPTPTQDITTVYATRNILGPLTTVFTAPQECTLAGIINSHTAAYRGQGCIVDHLADASTCWPQATAAAPLKSPPLNGWGFYSPGISCPAGYTSACSATQGSSTGWEMQFAMDERETAVGCCPTYVVVLAFCGVACLIPNT